jgi:hypothetical protein
MQTQALKARINPVRVFDTKRPKVNRAFSALMKQVDDSNFESHAQRAKIVK